MQKIHFRDKTPFSDEKLLFDSLQCYDLGEEREYFMDILKLCDKLFEDDDLKDIPIDYIFRVVNAVISAISSGDCFYKDYFD